jgi:outer membrane immunogenic protein
MVTSAQHSRRTIRDYGVGLQHFSNIKEAQGDRIMQRLLLGTAAAVAMVGSAIAADLPARPTKAPPAPPRVVGYNWTGCYVSGGGGYGMFNQDTTFVDGGVAVDGTTGGRGWFGTVGAGCDLQIGERWVFGAFGDYDFSDLKGDLVVPNTALTGREKQDSAWAAGGRLGYTLTPTILTYVNAGYTQARFDDINLLVGGAASNLSIGAQTYSGWFLGGGYEYRLEWFPGLFWKTEYRFAQYDRESLAILAGGVPTGASIDSEKTVQTIRSQLVWRFNWGGRY